MRKLILLAMVMAGMGAYGAAPAMAADSTCATHVLKLTGWSIQLDTISHSGSFQCGGANNESYNVELFLQFKNGSGNWVTADCPNSYLGLCISFKPSNGGWYGGGDPSQWSGTFNVNELGGIDCRDWRMHAGVTFHGGSPPVYYNSSVSSIGGC